MNPLDQFLSDIERLKSPVDTKKSIQTYFKAADQEADKLIQENKIKLDCRDGCSICCILRVELKAHEVFAIQTHIEQSFSKERKEKLIERLKAHAERIKPMTPEEHKATNVECPMLENNSCSIYPVRPFGCRMHHSYDLKSCEYSFENPHDTVFQGARDMDLTMLWHKMQAMSYEASKSEGFDNRGYELGTSLLTALSSPTHHKRWRQKKNPLLPNPNT